MKKQLLKILIKSLVVFIISALFVLPIIMLIDWIFPIDFNYIAGCIFNVCFSLVVGIVGNWIGYLEYHSLSVKHSSLHAYPELEREEKKEIGFGFRVKYK
jgi:hypothetical protein